MTPSSAAPSPLPLLDGAPIFLPILGRGPDGAARFLRCIAQDGQPTAATSDAQRTARVMGAVVTTVRRTLCLVSFGDGTCIFGALQGANIRFYPQPLFAALGTSTHATLVKHGGLVDGLVEAIQACPPVARSAEAALMGGHLWPTWTFLDLTAIAEKRGVRPPSADTTALVHNLVHALPAPLCPPQRRSLDHIEILVRGRMVTLDGFTSPTAHIQDGPVVAHNTAWAERLCTSLVRLFGDTALFPDWTLVRQHVGGGGADNVGAGVVWQARLPLMHTHMSMHDKMRCAASLPTHVFAA